MIRLRLPRLSPRPSDHALPPELRWDAAPASAAMLLGRREFLKALGVVLAALALPIVRAERAIARARGGFFTKTERATLEALVDRIIPPDAGPGAEALGAAHYIEELLTALDRKRTRLFAGGPFSGRTPFPDSRTGVPSRKRPPNRFKKFIPPTRLQELFWRGELFGTAVVPELAALDAQLGGAKKGLRDLYRESLAKVDAVATMTKGGPFASLATGDQDAVLAMLDAGAFAHDPRRGGATFIDVAIRHTLEGCFSVPEYGGNVKTQGWALIGLEGDSQPLGYSIFSEATGGYVERADHPMTTANPDELSGAKPLGPEGQMVQDTIVSLTSIFSDGSLC
jgi:hypothetical protein